MKRLAIFCTLASMVFLLGGCATSKFSDNPNSIRFDVSNQYKLQAAEHWHIIAEHMAEQLSADLKTKEEKRPLFIVQASSEFPFVEGFRELLTTAMLARGWDIRLQPKDALPVDIRYSIYRFRPDRTSNTYYYGDATMLVAGIWAVSGILDANNISVGAKILSSVATIEGFSWMKNEGRQDARATHNPVPRSEIILTAMVTDEGKIIARRSNLYYSADEDAILYWKKTGASQSTNVKVRGE